MLAKTFTKSWVGRLQDMVARHMVKEQGCGQKGQGAPEHLWAFMNLVEEGMEPWLKGVGLEPSQGHMPCLLMLQRHTIRFGGMACISLYTPWG